MAAMGEDSCRVGRLGSCALLAGHLQLILAVAGNPHFMWERLRALPTGSLSLSTISSVPAAPDSFKCRYLSTRGNMWQPL